MTVRRKTSRSMPALYLLLSLAWLLAGCGGGSGGGSDIGSGGDPDAGGTGTSEEVIGAEGGSLDGPGGAVLQVPAGALDGDLALTITSSADSADEEGVVQISALFEVGPAGTQFAVPVSLALPYDAVALPEGRTEADIRVYTARAQAGPYEELPTAAGDGVATATVEHLSFFFVGTRAVEGGGEVPDPGDYTFSETVSFVARIQVPTAEELGECCFDFSGDERPDNQAGVLLGAMADAYDPNTDMDLTNSIQQAIDADRTSYLFEFRGLPDGDGPVDLRVWPSSGDIDRDGEPDQSPRERFGGEGVFQVELAGFGAHTAGGAFASANVADGVLTAEGAEMTIKLGMRGGDFLTLPVSQLRLEGAVDITESGVATPDVTAGDQQAMTGLRAGGVIPVRGFLAQLEAVTPTCACAQVDPTQPVIEWEMTGGELRASCVQDIVDIADEHCHSQHQGFICGQLDQICRALPLIASLADVSSGVPGDDGLPGDDAYSFGALISLAPAALADEKVGPALRAVDDEYLIRPERPVYRMDILGNDVDAVNGAPKIASVTQPPVGTVTILGDGAAVQYELDGDQPGMHEFTYTIEAGDLSSTATVLVVLLEGWGGGPAVTGVDDEVSVYAYRGPQIIGGLLDNDDIPEGWEGVAQISTVGNWQNAMVEVGPDRRSIVYDPVGMWAPGDSPTVEYGISMGQPNMYMGSAVVTINLLAPDVVCGDGWLDDWAGEECDPGPGRNDAECTSECKLVACPSGVAPLQYFEDADGDSYGDPMKAIYTCDGAPEGYAFVGTDCDDSDETIHPGAEEICGDGVNNACGRTYDCGVEQCMLLLPCAEERCDDGEDNDGDGRTDCDDPQCENSDACTENCFDGIDNNGNGLIDCYDEQDCGWVEPCRESVCDDGEDGDLDGDVDCDDADCAWLCPESDCFDGIDNDNDFGTDCEDFGCALVCPEADCDDGFDDDFDGAWDCEDPGCADDPACQ